MVDLNTIISVCSTIDILLMFAGKKYNKVICNQIGKILFFTSSIFYLIASYDVLLSPSSLIAFGNNAIIISTSSDNLVRLSVFIIFYLIWFYLLRGIRGLAILITDLQIHIVQKLMFLLVAYVVPWVLSIYTILYFQNNLW